MLHMRRFDYVGITVADLDAARMVAGETLRREHRP
jgi:hypothetical protein